ncbi:MAG: heavy-metal-associated domain-containing protein [Alphaproteobacteria bacterium]
MTEAKTIVLSVKGMTCGGCAEAVKRVICKVDSVAEVSVDLASGRVQASTQVDGAALAAAVTKAGYDAIVAR